MIELVLPVGLAVGFAAVWAMLRLAYPKRPKRIESQPPPASEVDFAALALSAFNPANGVTVCRSCGTRLDEPGAVAYRVDGGLVCETCVPSGGA